MTTISYFFNFLIFHASGPLLYVQTHHSPIKAIKNTQRRVKRCSPRLRHLFSQSCKIIIMNSLKFALSTDEHPSKGREKPEVNGSLLKGVNRSKAEAVWALDVDSNQKVTEESLNTDGMMRILNQKLETAFKKDSKNISEVVFERIVEEFQDEAGGSKSELTYLLLIQDKLTDIQQFARPEFKPFLDEFSDLLESKIVKMRKKQKKAELSNFENIVSGNFKKKTEEKVYLNVEEPKIVRRSKEKERQSSKSPRKASGSHDNKLNRLFSKEKNPLKQREMKESLRRGQQDAPINATANPNQDESVSFSAVLSNNVTVKTRRRKNSGQAKKEKPKKTQQKGGEGQQGDEAFMFFRPKKNKK